jgi:hypothetical protein
LTGEPDDVCLLRHYEEQFSDLKKEVADVRNTLLSLGVEESDDLVTSHVSLERGISECSLNLKRSLHSHMHVSHASAHSDGTGVKLPKLDVPTFNGDILNWLSFWEQFSVAVDSRTNLSDTEKSAILEMTWETCN